MGDEELFSLHGRTDERVEDRPKVDSLCLIVKVHLEVLKEGATQDHSLIETSTGLVLALVRLNQDVAYLAMLRGLPLLKQSLPRD